MPRGYPDFFGYSVFPQFGAYQMEAPLVMVVAAGMTEVVYDITGKGVLIGGFLEISGTDDPANIHVRFDVDGTASYDYLLEYFLVSKWDRPGASMFYCTLYDTVNQWYNLDPTPGLTFSVGLEITVANLSVGDIGIASNLWWQRVQAGA